MNVSLFRRPAAYLPLAMSFAALLVVLGHVSSHGIVRAADERAAHVFQLLVGAQIPIAAYVALRWLPRAPRDGAWVLVVQAIAVLVACAPIAALGL